ncbi:cell wall protein DAN4-like isoform X2 [Mizuhopecten yessoensis]|uniref:cell wall protein DAN4-like isoform X2 n=1 Tax=Mizuhopecten yessoensis TaxID=6573 RepID=UPI000B45A56F|nr:cell wall protein DAN4-like isoform X2 [Mizuhopecten yessoensis]
MFMFGSLHDMMGAWRQCKLCPWRRALHVYMLYTTYIVTWSATGRATVISPTSSEPNYTAASSTWRENPKFTCKPSCNILNVTGMQQQACRRQNSYIGFFSCRNDSRCRFKCSSENFNTTVSLNMTAVCDTDAGQEDNSLTCYRVNRQSLQFEKPDYLTWSDFCSKMQFDVTCYLVTTTTCSSADQCCRYSIRNCTMFITTTTTERTTTPTTTTERTTTPTTSTTRSTIDSILEKGTSTPKTSTTGINSPGVFTSSASTQTVTEGRSTASQTDSDHVPTITAVVSLLVLSIVVISIIVIIVLRRNRRKPAENPEFVINNTAYGDVTLHPKTHPGPDNPQSSRGVPAKPAADEEHTYCYASFDDRKQTVNTESQYPNVQDHINATTSPDGSYFVLDKGSPKHGYNYKKEQAIVMEHLVEKETGHMKNKLDNPSNYFVLEKPNSIYDTKRQDTDETANYFVLETTPDEHEPGVKRNHEEEITETDDTRSGKVDDNYFLVDKSDVGTTADDRETSNVSSNHSTIENQDHTSNDNYFVLDKITDDSKVVKHMETHCGNGLQNSDNTETCAKPRANGTPTTTDDPYDHVRIGHAHTNGFDDGVYDELRKQHVRYEADEVENDYDHC